MQVKLAAAFRDIKHRREGSSFRFILLSFPSAQLLPRFRSAPRLGEFLSRREA